MTNEQWAFKILQESLNYSNVEELARRGYLINPLKEPQFGILGYTVGKPFTLNGDEHYEEGDTFVD